MQPPVYSTELIEDLVNAICASEASQEDKHIFREALQGLVRLAQAEQLLSIQLDFHTMTTGRRAEL